LLRSFDSIAAPGYHYPGYNDDDDRGDPEG
jgi:hypothetical protein